MAGQWSARPQGASVRAQRLAGGMFEFAAPRDWVQSIFASRLEIAAIAHLALLAAFEFKSSSSGATSLLVLTGIVLVLLALMHNGGVFKEPKADACSATAISHTTCISSPEAARVLTPTGIAIERQAQRLVEIADSAVRSKLQADERGQAWADLMARVSHELRTPLNAVLGFTDLMRSEVMGPVGHPRYMEYLDHIQVSGRALLKSAEDTLALTALLAAPGSASVPEVLDLEEFAKEAWIFASTDASSRGISFDMSGLEGLEILGERRPLRQTLINLFSCAMARGADGSQVSLSATADGDVVEVVLTLSKISKDVQYDAGCLSLSLARALLELQDTFLLEPPVATGGWRAVTVFAAASQPDFFA